MRLRPAVVVALIVLANPASARTAPDETGETVRFAAGWPPVAAELEAGDSIRVNLRTITDYEGVVISTTDSTLALDGERGVSLVPALDIEKLWVRGRATRTGATVGVIVGGVAGALLGAAMAEYGNMEGGDTDPALGALGGGLIGGTLMGLLGAGIGAATPKWHLKYEAGPDTLTAAEYEAIRLQTEEASAPDKAEGKGRTGALRIMGGYSVCTRSGEPGGDIGGLFDYLSQVKPTLSLGPEIGYSWLGGSANFWHLGATAILSPTRWKDKYYLVGGLELYDWTGEVESAGGIGFSLGGGHRFYSQSGRSSLDLELRWRSNVSRAGIDGVSSLISVMAGYHRRW